MHTDWSSLSFFNCNDFGSHWTKTHIFTISTNYNTSYDQYKKTCLVSCWPSGKYVNWLYMYSILGRGSFCFNYCLNWWYGSPGFFDSGLQLICIFLVSCFSFSSWQYPIDSLWGSGLVNFLASQAHQHHDHLTNCWCIWQCGQVPNPAGK